jgi:predicted protein tyrosine phosphatase
MTNVLFVCSANRLRSPTAEQVFSTWPGVETDSAGLSAGASVLLSSEQVDWADIIFVMEKTHRNKLTRQFRARLKNKRVVCLDIPDEYDFMDPDLVRILENKVGRFLS